MKSCGEVSNRLIIGIGILIVFVILAVPLGFTLWPRLATLFKGPEKLVLIVDEDFEEKVPGEFKKLNLYDGDCWRGWKYAFYTHEGLDAAEKGSGMYSMRLTGLAIQFSRQRPQIVLNYLQRKIPASDAFQIEFNIRLGNESFMPKEDYGERGIVSLTHGSNQDDLLTFSHDGKAYCINDRNPICKWKPGRWYCVKIRFDKGEKESKINIDLSGAKRTVSCPVYAEESKEENVILQFSSGIGTVWIDNVRVWRVME